MKSSIPTQEQRTLQKSQPFLHFHKSSWKTYEISLYDPQKKGSSLSQIRDNKHSKDEDEKKIKTWKKRNDLFDKQYLKERKSCREKQREYSS